MRVFFATIAILAITAVALYAQGPGEIWSSQGSKGFQQISFTLRVPQGFKGVQGSDDSMLFEPITGTFDPNAVKTFLSTSEILMDDFTPANGLKDRNGGWDPRLVKIFWETMVGQITGVQSHKYSIVKGFPAMDMRIKNSYGSPNPIYLIMMTRIVIVDKGLISLDCGAIFADKDGTMDNTFINDACKPFQDSLVVN